MSFDEFIQQEKRLAAIGSNPDIVVLRFAQLHEKEMAGRKRRLREVGVAPEKLSALEAKELALLHAVMMSRWRWKSASEEARQRMSAKTPADTASGKALQG